MKALFKKLGYFLFLTFAVLLILELLFRFQVVDFYATEFSYLNSSKSNHKTEKTVLIFGDSFTATQNSYVDELRLKNPTINFVNTAISGTGIKQHQLLFKKRIQQTKPDEIIYQFYVGNDFLDINHPINWEKLSIARNTFWWVSENFLFLQYLNYKLSGLSGNHQSSANLIAENFEAEMYNKREKLQFIGNPKYLKNTIQLNNEAVPTYKKWADSFHELVDLCGDSIQLSLLIIPHCSQISKQYLNTTAQVGAEVDSTFFNSSYPLLSRITEDFLTIKILNPIQHFQPKEKNGILLYYRNDPHLNGEGQKMLAQFLFTRND